MTIIGIDPGDTRTAVCLLRPGNLISAVILDNEDAIGSLRLYHSWGSQVVCEMVASYGMPVGKSIFDTCVWIGRFWQVCPGMKFITRIQVKSAICHSAKANDSNIRQALIDRYGPAGTKKNPGPTYGISKDMWSALAVATAYRDGAKLYEFTA